MWSISPRPYFVTAVDVYGSVRDNLKSHFLPPRPLDGGNMQEILFEWHEIVAPDASWDHLALLYLLYLIGSKEIPAGHNLYEIAPRLQNRLVEISQSYM
jgi:hypothetical protein